MQKTITYLYPDSRKASSFKCFRIGLIKLGHLFYRENIKEVERLESGKLCRLFLFNEAEDNEITSLYWTMGMVQ